MAKPPTKRQPRARSIADGVQATLWALAAAGAVVVLPQGRKIPFDVIAGAVSYGFLSGTKRSKKPTRPKGRTAKIQEHLKTLHQAERLAPELKGKLGRRSWYSATYRALVERTYGKKDHGLTEQLRRRGDTAKKRRRDWFPKAKDLDSLSLGEAFEVIATEQDIVAGNLPGYPAPRGLRALHEK